MKLHELKLGHKIGDIIGKSPVGSSLIGKEKPEEQISIRKSVAVRRIAHGAFAGQVEQPLGDLYSEFSTWMNKKDIPDDKLAGFLKDLELQATERGQTFHSMMDDMLSPLDVDQLKTLMRIGTPALKHGAKEEYSHRDQ